MLSIAPLVEFAEGSPDDCRVEKKSRQAKVTPEHKKESERLKALWDVRAVDTTQGAFGAEYGIGGQGAVWQFLNGKTPLSIKAAEAFARGLKCDVAEFSPRLAQEIKARSQWPFRVLTPAQWDDLDQAFRDEIEKRILGEWAMRSGESTGQSPLRNGTDG